MARTVHTRRYAGVGAAYGAILDWLTELGYVADGVPWESYLDAPEVPEPAHGDLPALPPRPAGARLTVSELPWARPPRSRARHHGRRSEGRTQVESGRVTTTAL